MILSAVLRTDQGEAVDLVALYPKAFASGRVGWFGQSKATVDGERYQVQVQVVRIRRDGDHGSDQVEQVDQAARPVGGSEV